jgi:hypothetical protein
MCDTDFTHTGTLNTVLSLPESRGECIRTGRLPCIPYRTICLTTLRSASTVTPGDIYV